MKKDNDLWQESQHGLYRQFNFADFKEAWAFMERVAALAERLGHHPRWENEWSVVQIWLITHEGGKKITAKDRELAAAIDDAVDTSKQEVTSLETKSKPTKRYKKLTIYADGGSRGNPGHSASGYVLLDENENVIEDKGIYLGITTNNQAEYQALKFALEDAKKLEAQEVAVFMDSLLVVNQMKGIFKVKNRDLWPIHDDIKKLVQDFHHVSFTQVPRELNKKADAAVNRVLDEEAEKRK
jgi:ribonuclease HI/pterin-4a-carbinolamine dehydratase